MIRPHHYCSRYQNLFCLILNGDLITRSNDRLKPILQNVLTVNLVNTARFKAHTNWFKVQALTLPQNYVTYSHYDWLHWQLQQACGQSYKFSTILTLVSYWQGNCLSIAELYSLNKDRRTFKHWPLVLK